MPVSNDTALKAYNVYAMHPMPIDRAEYIGQLQSFYAGIVYAVSAIAAFIKATTLAKRSHPGACIRVIKLKAYDDAVGAAIAANDGDVTLEMLAALPGRDDYYPPPYAD